MKKQGSLTIVISGSFRKHLSGIQEKIREFKSLGFKVLSPAVSNALNPTAEFVFLESDETTDKKQLEERHLHAISQVSALYIFNPDGYTGSSVQLEMGYALGCGKPVYSFQGITDMTLNLFSRVATPEGIKQDLIKKL